MDYVVGFLFSTDERRVVLMEKKRPNWQLGKLNGPGGKVQDEETPYDAMKREFMEEAGAVVTFWRPFCYMRHGENRIIFFVAKEDVPVRTTTDEPVRWYDLDDEADCTEVAEKMLPNCAWLLPMAVDKDKVTASVMDPS